VNSGTITKLNSDISLRFKVRDMIKVQKIKLGLRLWLALGFESDCDSVVKVIEIGTETAVFFHNMKPYQNSSKPIIWLLLHVAQLSRWQNTRVMHWLSALMIHHTSHPALIWRRGLLMRVMGYQLPRAHHSGSSTQSLTVLGATATTALARPSHHNSVCSSVPHTGGSVKNGAS